ncbi:MAG TPA: hypothetical protein VJ695_08075 [Nitrososphaera sp.]|nr:hypothetical protein [Nitrososphaera sp.]
MARAAEHPFDTPFFAGPILVAPQLFAANGAMNDLFFPEEMQIELMYLSGYKNVYPSAHGM